MTVEFIASCRRIVSVLAAFSLPTLAAAQALTTPSLAVVAGGFVGIAERASGFAAPLGVTSARDGSNRLFIVEQGGLIRIWNGAQVLPTPFLDVSSLISSGGERGLLGLAFHPSYSSNGFLYVNYTRAADGNTVIARYQLSASDPNVADPASARILFVVQQPAANHNGGQLAFGPDGYLYIGLGDGGGANDPLEVAQDLSRRAGNQGSLGKMLRIDVDQNVASPPYYGIPATNPYTSTGDPLDAIPDEIWARGLRNPWRYSFDRLTGDLYIGDVGQSTREEVDFRPSGSPGGANFGWDVLEGTFCHEDVPAGSCAALLAPGGSVLPILEYGRNEGSTVIGGNVYRGRPTSPVLTGRYVFGDFGSGSIWRALRSNGSWTKQALFLTTLGPTAFGESDDGGLFMVSLTQGKLHQIAPYTFADVPPGNAAWRFVETIFGAGVMSGCSGTAYCPFSAATRGQMAVFLLRSRLGASYVPAACSNPSFSDVPCSHPFAAWIYDLVGRGVAGGCAAGRYCPDAAVSRAQMAIFLLRTLDSAIDPPACNAGAPLFSDVAASSPYCRWIEEVARRGITTGCRAGSYCPLAPVTRGQMAVFLVATFGLLPV
jgi:glucose/arabinose dehydrogenase